MVEGKGTRVMEREDSYGGEGEKSGREEGEEGDREEGGRE